MTRIWAAAAAVAALLAAPAASSDEWADQVDRLIDAAAEPILAEGYHYGGFSREGSLGDDGSEDLKVRLGAGMEFMLVGACDTDCSDLDLTLYGPDGGEIASDLLTDDFPIVHVTPKSDGIYRLHVAMVACSAEPCRYAVQPFVR